MSKKIIDLTKMYGKNETRIIICNKLFDGQINLTHFKFLIRIDCSSNSIDKIIGVDKCIYLNAIDCSFNNLTDINNLPPRLNYLNCSHNFIKSFENLPNSIKTLIC